jgi:DNA-binding CsgD family transcriptional regulator
MSQLPDWVRRRTLPAETPADIRAAVTNDLMETVNANYGLYHGVGFYDGEFLMQHMMPQGKTTRLEFARTFDGKRVSAVMDTRPTAMTTFNGFRIYLVDEIRDNILYDTFWKRGNVRSNISMSVVCDGSFAGWIGAFRVDDEPDFTIKDRQRLQQRVAAYCYCIDMARRLEGHAPRSRALLLLNDRGDITHMCARAARLIDNNGLLDQIRAVLPKTTHVTSFTLDDRLVRVTAIAGVTGRLFCVDIVPALHWKVPALAMMSLQKRRVAELVALGATVDEIGRGLDLSPWTVRTYLRQIYESLGIASRVELAEAVWNITDPEDAVVTV